MWWLNETLQDPSSHMKNCSPFEWHFRLVRSTYNELESPYTETFQRVDGAYRLLMQQVADDPNIGRDERRRAVDNLNDARERYRLWNWECRTMLDTFSILSVYPGPEGYHKDERLKARPGGPNTFRCARSEMEVTSSRHVLLLHHA
jgi:hypothetical protein